MDTPEFLEDWIDRWREFRARPWEPLSTAACTALGIAMALMALLHRTGEEGWVPFLDGINLVFHEAGHPIFGLFGETLGILGGTLMQLLVPLAVAASFVWRRHPASAALAGAWFFQNFWNIARYMSDARDQILPLVGGGEHDWAALLTQWGLLQADTRLAAGVGFLGWMGFLACGLWAAWRWHLGRRDKGNAPGAGAL